MTSEYVVKSFESLDALADYAAVPGGYRSSGGDAWAGGTFAEALNWTRNGDASYVARSDALMEKFERREFLTSRREWRNDVAGFVPNVPAYIAGLPQAMRRRPRRLAPAAPITVYVDLFLSAAFDARAAMTRGAAVLALVRILAAARPINLYVGYATAESFGRITCPIVRINTTPLDLSHAAYTMCSTSFIRHIGLAVFERMSPGSHKQSWPPFRGDLREVVARAFDPGTELLLVPGGIISTIVRDPEEWIAEKLREVQVGVVGEAGEAA